MIEEGTDLDEAQKFLEHAVKAEECYDSVRRPPPRRFAAEEATRAKKKAAK